MRFHDQDSPLYGDLKGPHDPRYHPRLQGRLHMPPDDVHSWANDPEFLAALSRASMPSAAFDPSAFAEHDYIEPEPIRPEVSRVKRRVKLGHPL